jgi:prophage antirepressor-like protein
MNKGEIVLYRTKNNDVAIDVIVEEETVWLTQAQMAKLFETTPQNITAHIRNAYSENELERESTCKDFLQVQTEGGRSVSRKKRHYNLDMIITVGYRVKSQRGVQFRRWATQVLKDYTMRGYAINQRLEQLESRVAKTEEEIRFFIKTALPPKEGVFYDGQIFDAYLFASDLIRAAKREVVLLDNYLDETVLLLLSKRKLGVAATVYTGRISKQLQLDLAQHNRQYDPITILVSNVFHDRFLIVDGIVYHIGASLKDLGKKMFAFSKMELSAAELLKTIYQEKIG